MNHHRIGNDIVRRVALGILVPAILAFAQSPDDRPRVYETEDGTIVAGGLEFASWGEFGRSEFFRVNGMRCGTVTAEPDGPAPQGGSPGNCAFSSTNPLAVFDPSVVKYRIPVAFHVIRQNNGTTGNVTEARINENIAIMNEDFLALPGTNGAPGTDVQIEFYLATEDPLGNPTNGITYSNNTTWYNDGGSYWTSLAWDTNRYLNIYTNSAGGNLGYVPNLPQGGIVGSTSDRVVVFYSTVGNNAPYGPPYHLGRTLTHEVGHYLGLHHTFASCGTVAACYTSGDYICDTLRDSQPVFGCFNQNDCGDPDSYHNYMDYTDDVCMWEFSPEGARRMRCTLEHWRPNLYEIVDESCGNGLLDAGETCDTAIHGGDPGTCPKVCDSGDPCIVGTLMGQGTCQAQCDFVNIVNPVNGDGCCPPGANALTDDDCVAQCGNGVCEPGETEITCSADCDCSTDPQCGPDDLCTVNHCTIGQCVADPRPYGNVNDDDVVDIFDILCVLDAFSGGPGGCVAFSADIAPCETAGDGTVDIFDILAVISAFAGDFACCGP
ncbi:MAG: hypothetical protein HOP29_17420 [Phycisphaerales bacterium]|nr:hypothetical protein [Phycisphaerales bacterium]